jgi:hypothetical protein
LSRKTRNKQNTKTNNKKNHMAGKEHEDDHSTPGTLQSQADKSGYTVRFGNAIPTDKGGTSGDVAFLWAKQTSVTVPHEITPGGLAAITFTTAFGSITLINLYGQRQKRFHPSQGICLRRGYRETHHHCGGLQPPPPRSTSLS